MLNFLTLAVASAAAANLAPAAALKVRSGPFRCRIRVAFSFVIQKFFLPLPLSLFRQLPHVRMAAAGTWSVAGGVQRGGRGGVGVSGKVATGLLLQGAGKCSMFSYSYSFSFSLVLPKCRLQITLMLFALSLSLCLPLSLPLSLCRLAAFALSTNIINVYAEISTPLTAIFPLCLFSFAFFRSLSRPLSLDFSLLLLLLDVFNMRFVDLAAKANFIKIYRQNNNKNKSSTKFMATFRGIYFQTVIGFISFRAVWLFAVVVVVVAVAAKIMTNLICVRFEAA